MQPDEIERFIDAVRSRSEFIEAAATDPDCHFHLAEVERWMHFVASAAISDHRLIDDVDELRRLMASNSLRPAINKFIDVLTRIRDGDRRIN